MTALVTGTATGLTPAAAAFLCAAGVAALADWWSVAGERGTRVRTRYVAKPAVLTALIGVAATLHTTLPVARGWFLPALVCCLAGDVLLMLPGERTAAFAGGLAAFLAGHALFLVGLVAGGHPHLPPALVAAGVIALAAAWPLSKVLRGVAEHLGRAMVGPVVLYVCALAAMAAVAWAVALRLPGGDALFAAGGSLFVVSDSLLSFDRFVTRIPRGDLLVHVTYHLAVAALVLALARP